MNERMIELYREASEFAYKICREEGREGGTGDHIWNTLSTGKFAELIVQECMRVALDEIVSNEDIDNTKLIEDRCYLQGNNGGVVDVVVAIKQHFGVEE